MTESTEDEALRIVNVCTARGCESSAVARFVEMCEHEHQVQGFRCAAPEHALRPVGPIARCKECGHHCRASRVLFPVAS